MVVLRGSIQLWSLRARKIQAPWLLESRMTEYKGYRILPGWHTYEQIANFTVFRPEATGDVVVYQDILSESYPDQESARAAAEKAARAYIDGLQTLV